MPVDFVKKYFKYLGIYSIIYKNYKFDIDFLDKNISNVSFRYLYSNQKFSEDFIEKYKDYYNKDIWDIISFYQNLSEEFIEKYFYKSIIEENFDDIVKFNKVSLKFLDKYFNYINDYTYIENHYILDEYFIEKTFIKSFQRNL